MPDWVFNYLLVGMTLVAVCLVSASSIRDDLDQGNITRGFLIAAVVLGIPLWPLLVFFILQRFLRR